MTDVDGVNGRLLTADEVAELLSMKLSWVREHTRSGAIPHVPLGRYKRYREVDVLAWVDTLATVGKPRSTARPDGAYDPRNSPRTASTAEGVTATKE